MAGQGVGRCWALLGVADGNGLAKGERSAVTSEGDVPLFSVLASLQSVSVGRESVSM